MKQSLSAFYLMYITPIVLIIITSLSLIHANYRIKSNEFAISRHNKQIVQLDVSVRDLAIKYDISFSGGPRLYDTAYNSLNMIIPDTDG
ncbi:MAG: hypothetical protein CMF46_04215 [Legionellales bacterium]|nr:hypothetical protein [Legionellales bacterium]|tara:strand:- start:2272 stop:2538 length:267 start_codon:yes stop_codon:yes gene_type:complete